MISVVTVPLRRARKSRRLILAGALILVLLAWLAIAVGTAHAAATLLSQGKPATASSVENAGTPASAAVDGNTGTRWSSAFSDPQWIQVDLGSTATVSQVVLQWETAYATAFQIQVSADASTWTTIYSTTTGTGGTQTLNVSGTGRYVRMYGTARGHRVRVLALGVPGLRHARQWRRLRYHQRRAEQAGHRVLDRERR